MPTATVAQFENIFETKNLNDYKHELTEKIQNIFEHNAVSGYSKWKHTQYHYIAPAKVEYLYQWLWDTAFHAIVLSHFNTNWAKNEIRNFLMAQWPEGFLPHVIFWGDSKFLPHWAYIESKPSWRPRTSAITQPPVLPIAVEAIYQKDHDLEFLHEVLPKLAKHHIWLLENRDPDEDYLISIISPNESGMDELPVFQVAMGFTGQDTARLHYIYRKADLLNYRFWYNSKKILEKDYFNIEEVLFNCVFIESARSLARLFKIIERDEEEVFFTQVATKSEQALLEKCWDTLDGIFYSLNSKKEQQVKVKTIASLLPLFLDGLTGHKLHTLIERHLLNENEFWLPYPIPSVSKDEIYYLPQDVPIHKFKLLWRGPTWVNTNWFIVKGLRKHGYNEVADYIVSRMVIMIEKYGFREYYNPETGEGYRRKNFGWSTLLLDLL